MNADELTVEGLSKGLKGVQSGMEILDLPIADGQRIRYWKMGRGRPLVLIHTLRTQIEYFRDVIPVLAEDFTVYAMDLPGHGASTIDTSAPYDERYLRKAVIAFVQRLDLRDVVLAGESIGAVLALTASVRLGDRVTGIVASNPYDYEKRYADGVRRGNLLANVVLMGFSIPYLGVLFAALENLSILTGILRGGVCDSDSLPLDLASIFDRTGHRPGYRYVERKIFSEWRSWADVRHMYTLVHVRVLMFQAEHDWSRPDERRRSAQALKDVSVVRVSDAGHFAFLERAKLMTDRIRAEFAGRALRPAA